MEAEVTTFNVIGSILGTDGTFKIVNINGNVEKAVTRKRILQVLANVTVSVIRGVDDDNDGLSEIQLMEKFQDELNQAFVEQDIKLYRAD